MKRLIRLLAIAAVYVFFIADAYAGAYQKFYNITYDNPANLKSVKIADFIIGDTYINVRNIFRGYSDPFSGTAISHEVYNYPYGRIAYRINPKFVVGFDITHPVYANIQFPIGSILEYVSTSSILLDTDYSPRVSYQVNPKLALGAGLNINNMYRAELNFVSLRDLQNLVNYGSSWAYGWNVGLAYTATSKTAINLSYYSKIIQNSRGTSTLGTTINTGFQFKRIPIPAVISLGINQMITEKFSLYTIIRFEFWNILNKLEEVDTALNRNLSINEKYSNSWVGALVGNYKFTDKFAGFLGGQYDTSPQATAYRGAGLPAYKLYVVFVGGEYAITKSLSTKFSYGRGVSNPPIHKEGLSGLTSGREYISGHTADLSLIWHI